MHRRAADREVVLGFVTNATGNAVDWAISVAGTGASLTRGGR